jgi:uncharacterized membrane protein (UPF0127 family)
MTRTGFSMTPRTSRLFAAAMAASFVAMPIGGVAMIPGCDRQQAAAQGGPHPQSLKTVKMTLAGRPFTIEVADTPETQEIGMMYRDSVPGDRGMIFVFPDEDDRSFWMKNTRIPLDIVYADKNGKVVAVKSMKPYDLTGIESDKPAMYAIELNVGVANAIGLKVGDVIDVSQFKGPATAPSTAPAAAGNPTTAPTPR